MPLPESALCESWPRMQSRRSASGRLEGRSGTVDNTSDAASRRRSAPAGDFAATERLEGDGSHKDLNAAAFDAWLADASKSRTPDGVDSEESKQIAARFWVSGGTSEVTPRMVTKRLQAAKACVARQLGNGNWVLHRRAPRVVAQPPVPPATEAEEAVAEPGEKDPAARTTALYFAAVAEFAVDEGAHASYNNGNAPSKSPRGPTVLAMFKRKFSVVLLERAGVPLDDEGQSALALLRRARAGELKPIIDEAKAWVAALPVPFAQPPSVPLAQCLEMSQSIHGCERGEVQVVKPGFEVVRTQQQTMVSATVPETKRGVADELAVTLAVHASAISDLMSFRKFSLIMLLSGMYFSVRQGLELGTESIKRLVDWTPSPGTFSNWTRILGEVAKKRLRAILDQGIFTLILDGGARNSKEYLPRLAALKHGGVATVKMLDVDAAGKTGLAAADAICGSCNDCNDDGTLKPWRGAGGDGDAPGLVDGPRLSAVLTDSTSSMISDKKGGLSMKSLLLGARYFLCAFIPCMLHVLNLELKNAMEAAFGTPAIKVASAQQLIYAIHYVFSHQWDVHKLLYADFIRHRAEEQAARWGDMDVDVASLDPMLKKFSEPVLSRWWTIIKTASLALEHWDGISLFARYMFESQSPTLKKREIWQDIFSWMQPSYPRVRVDLAFVATFGMDYYNVWMRYLQQPDAQHPIGGWKARKMPRVVVEQGMRLAALLEGAWKTEAPHWKRFHDSELARLEPAERVTASKQYVVFFETALATHVDHAVRWCKELLFYGLGDEPCVARPLASAIAALLEDEEPFKAAMDVVAAMGVVAGGDLVVDGKRYDPSKLFKGMLEHATAAVARETWPVLMMSWQAEMFGGTAGFIDSLRRFASNGSESEALKVFRGQICDTICQGHCVERFMGQLGRITFMCPRISDEVVAAKAMIVVNEQRRAQQSVVSSNASEPRHANASMDCEGNSRETGEPVPRSKRFVATKANIQGFAELIVGSAMSPEELQAARDAVTSGAAGLKETRRRIESDGIESVVDGDVTDNVITRALAEHRRGAENRAKTAKPGSRRKQVSAVLDQPVDVPGPGSAAPPPETVQLSKLRSKVSRQAELKPRVTPARLAELDFPAMLTELQKYVIVPGTDIIKRLAGVQAPQADATAPTRPLAGITEGHHDFAKRLKRGGKNS